jgi:hypothetical protein
MFYTIFCLRPVSNADAEGLGTTISPLTHPPPFVEFLSARKADLKKCFQHLVLLQHLVLVV